MMPFRPHLIGNQFAKGKHHNLSELTKQKIADSKKRGKFIDCAFCSNKKWVRPSFIKIRKNLFCSKECSQKFHCGEKASGWGKTHTIERKTKASLLFRGERGPGWKGGKTSLQMLIRVSFLYRQWRSDIFTRDNFTCQICKEQRGGHLNADHIIPFSILLQKHEITSIEQAEKCEELWNLNNGRTLCLKCHRQTPTFGKLAIKYQAIS